MNIFYLVPFVRYTSNSGNALEIWVNHRVNVIGHNVYIDEIYKSRKFHDDNDIYKQHSFKFLF